MIKSCTTKANNMKKVCPDNMSVDTTVTADMTDIDNNIDELT